MNDFCYAFSAGDINGLMGLLHENGRFFNDLSKGRAAGELHKMMNGQKGIKSRNAFKYNRGISLDIFPGQEVLEIRCYNQNFEDDSMFDLDGFMGPKFGEPPVEGKNEIVYRFVFRYQDFKIIELKMASKAIANPKRIISNN
jgi:hypothetical protein